MKNQNKENKKKNIELCQESRLFARLDLHGICSCHGYVTNQDSEE